MKKALLSAAVAAIIAAPAAQAGVTIYGQMHLSIDQIDSDVSSTKDGSFVTSRDSRIGFKGTEDLGNGLAAIWQVETTVDISDSKAQNWADRNSFIGLKGGFGTILAGNHDTPYKRAMYSAGIEVIGDSILKMKRLAAAEDNRSKNTIMYISPDMSGFSLAAAGVTKEAAGSDLTDGYSLAAMYKNGGLRMGLGYEDNLGSWEEKVVGTIGYSFGDLSVAALYGQQKDHASKGDQDIMAVSGSYKFGNNKLVGIYTQNDEDGASKKDGWGLGLTHDMSKRTMAYVAYADSENGLESEFGSKTTAGSGFSIGMVHKF